MMTKQADLRRVTSALPTGRHARLRAGQIILALIAALAAGLAATLAVVRISFDRQLAREVEELFATGTPADPPILTEAGLAGLPEPVQRWLRASGVVGRARPTTVRLRYEGALLRYLGETIWFPAGAVAPSITWEARDADSAVATMTYGGVSASLTFVFDAEGRVIRQEAAARYNDARGRPERWSIPVTAYGQVEDVRVPTEGTGVWNYETSDYTYIRWRMTDVQYDRPQRY